MANVEMIFSNERQTWNVFVDGEWYFESADYEQADDCRLRLLCPDEEEEVEDYEEITQNMPCDISGLCGGSSCPNYPRCQGWVK